MPPVFLFATRPWKSLLAMSAIVLCSADVAALELGELSVRSPLGARFQGEVRLIDDGGEWRPSDTCFRLGASDAGGGEMPTLFRGRLHVERRGNQSSLIIISDQLINEPLLEINLYAGCGVEAVRRYTVMISPADVEKGTAQTVGSLPAMNVSSAPDRSPRSLDPDSANSVKAPTPKFAGRMTGHLLISDDSATRGIGSGLFLRTSTDLSVHWPQPVSENARAVLRLEYRLLKSLHEQIEQQLDVAERIRLLDASSEALRIARGNAERSVEAAAVQPAQKLSLSAEKLEKVRHVPPVPKLPESVSDEIPPWCSEGLIILGLIASLAWVLSRGSGKQGHPVSLVTENTAIAVKAHDLNKKSLWPDESRHGASLAVKSSFSEADLPIDGVTVPVPAEKPSVKHHLPFTPIELDKVRDCSTVMELAEIMVSFGRTNGAIQALEEFLEHDPDVVLAPWLKLLEIFRMNDMRNEFEACSARLKLHFNVSPGPWERAGETLKGPIVTIDEEDLTIEALLQRMSAIVVFPHLKENIQKAWDSPEGLVNLKKLLSETRDGSRGGFPLPIARELLALIDFLKNRAQNKV